MKIAVLIGARPQFIKAAPLCHELQSRNLEFELIHSGQHYDENLSDVFFAELGIPRPNLHLEIPRTTEAEQRDFIQERCVAYLKEHVVDVMLVFGDTTTTLAGAYAARDLGLPLVHVEAGLRSFNDAMPEEYNRIHTDRISTVLCCPSERSVEQLRIEGIYTRDAQASPSIENPRVLNVGDIMMDNLRVEKEKLGDPIVPMDAKKVLVTLHRQSNVDDPIRLRKIIESMTQWAEQRGWNYVFPVHPRTRQRLEHLPDLLQSMQESKHWELRDPIGFEKMLRLQLEVAFAVSDSGGLPKEMHFFNKSTLIMRTETEWVELLEHHWAKCVEPDAVALDAAWAELSQFSDPERPQFLYGAGRSAEAVVDALVDLM